MIKFKSTIVAEIISEAIILSTPLIEAIGGKEKGIAIVVTNPNIKFDPNATDDVNFDEVAWVKREIGLTTDKRRKYALAKAFYSWKSGTPSKYAATNPEVLSDGDCIWGGSHLIDLGSGYSLVVAVSGMKECEDEFISKLIINAIQMILGRKVAALKESDKLSAIV